MTVTLTAADSYQVVRCAPHGRPRRLPSGWAATPVGVDGRTRHTWLIYDPAAHNVAKVIGTPSPVLRRQLLRARCLPVTTVPGRTVYLVPRASRRQHPSPARSLAVASPDNT